MKLIIKKCPICGQDGDAENVCQVCGRDNFSDSCFDQASRRCLHCQWDPAKLFQWADGCGIPATKLPRERNELAALKVLHLTANSGIYSVDHISSEVANLTALKTLWIAAQPLREFPAELARLTNLAHVSLNTLELTEIPEFIFSLPRLQNLSLLNNNLTELPDKLTRIKSLKCLVLSANQLVNLPEAIAELRQLEELYIWDNKLTSLPESIFSDLPALKVLNVDGNPMNNWLKSNSSKLANYSTYSGKAAN